MKSMHSVGIVRGPGSRMSDDNVRAMVSFMGGHVQTIDARELRGWPDCALSLLQSWQALIVHAETLSDLCCDISSLERLLARVRTGMDVMVYGCSGKVPPAVLGSLSRGSVVAIEAVRTGTHRELPTAGAPISRDLAGSDYDGPAGADAPAVLVGPADESRSIRVVTASGHPTFLCIASGAGRLFLSTATDCPDVEASVTDERAVEWAYDELLPFLMFLRSACGAYAWQGGRPAARLIIDDPLLRTRYGCLNFNALFDSLRRHDYAATVAFIPWNHNRTSARDAAFFLSAVDRVSICVHGCDHTANEFGEFDQERLRHKCELAKRRLECLQSRTGLGFERVMVFPQGHFSRCSLGALRASGFLAAVNSTRLPVDVAAQPATFGDLLLPAVTGASGFPVFGRHYTGSTFPFLFDLFLGRPAFLVEHHGFFRSGLPLLESLVSRINQAPSAPSWAPLETSLERACLTRARSAKLREVRFFTDRFRLTNDSDESVSYLVWKREPQMSGAGMVFVDGASETLERDGDRLAAEVNLEPRQSARIVIVPGGKTILADRQDGTFYSGGVLLRRRLSEFRDQVLADRPVLLAAAQALLRNVKGVRTLTRWRS